MRKRDKEREIKPPSWSLSSALPQPAEHGAYGVRHPCGHLGSPVPAVSPPHSWCTPSLLRGVVRSREAKMLRKPCSEIAETSLCYQNCLQHKYKIQPFLL